MTLLPTKSSTADAAFPEQIRYHDGYAIPACPATGRVSGSIDWRPRELLGTIPIAPTTNERSKQTQSPSWLVERQLLKRVLDRLGSPQFEVELWDGTVVQAGVSSLVQYRIRIRQRAALWRLLLNPAFHFPEGYAQGVIEIDGDLLGFLCELNRIWRHCPPSLPTAWYQWLNGSLRRYSLAASRNNVKQHYDLGNDFYRLWLDQQLLYTCAYFPEAEMTLEDAQIAKMDHICRKLRLKPGESVVEAGCGWGALAIHMAQHYGVKVTAWNVSVEQVRYARARAETLGLADRVEFVLDDWRHLRGHHDAFVSVGMLEHVGPEHFEQLGQVIHRCLSPNGRGLIHSIGQNHVMPLNPWIERRIFPGAEPPALEQISRIFPAGELTVYDVENLRLHYAQTLWHWLQRFEQHVESIRPERGEEFIRTWRMYLALSYSAFETGGLQLYQFVFAPTDSNRITRTRADWYRSDTSCTGPRSSFSPSKVRFHAEARESE